MLLVVIERGCVPHFMYSNFGTTAPDTLVSPAIYRAGVLGLDVMKGKGGSTTAVDYERDQFLQQR